jgi:hypothetical protein
MTESFLAVVVNDDLVLKYDRGKTLTELQQRYLDTLDRKMDDGLTLDGEVIPQPDTMMCRDARIQGCAATHRDVGR